MKMYDACPNCGLDLIRGPGFYFGTGYVSYALSIALSVAFFIATLVLGSLSVNDDSLYYWLFYNTLLLLIMQPLLMRLSRSIWISFFVKFAGERMEREEMAA